MAGLLGAGFVAALGDVCQTRPFTAESLQALAARLLNDLARLCARQLTADPLGRGGRPGLCGRPAHRQAGGAAALSGCCERIFRALSEYCLRQDRFQPWDGGFGGAGRGALLFGERQRPGPPGRPACLPSGTAGPRRSGRSWTPWWALDEVKEYVFGLADNVRVQKAPGRRRASRRPACRCT